METKEVQKLGQGFNPPLVDINLPTKKRKESPTNSEDETGIQNIATTTINNSQNTNPTTKQRKLEPITEKIEKMELTEEEQSNYLDTVEKIKDNLTTFVALVSFSDAYSQQGTVLYDKISDSVDQLKKKIEVLLGEVAQGQIRETKRGVRLEPVDVEKYKKDVLQPMEEEIKRLQGRFTELDQEVKAYKTDGVTSDALVNQCQSCVLQYTQLADAIWSIRKKVESTTAALQQNIKDSTFVPHTDSAIATNIALFYVDSKEQNMSDQKCLEENKKKYEQLQYSLEQMQAREFRAAKGACDNLVKDLNWLCYQYVYLLQNSKLPSYYLTTSVPITVINPFTVLLRPEGGAVARDKKTTFLVEKTSTV